MIEISRTQDEEVGDGTTSVIILGKNTKIMFVFNPLETVRGNIGWFASYQSFVQYCAKVMQTNFDKFPDFSGLFDENSHFRDTYGFNPANFQAKIRCAWYFAVNF